MVSFQKRAFWGAALWQEKAQRNSCDVCLCPELGLLRLRTGYRGLRVLGTRSQLNSVGGRLVSRPTQTFQQAGWSQLLEFGVVILKVIVDDKLHITNLRVGKHLRGFQMPVCGLAASDPPGQRFPRAWPSHYSDGKRSKETEKNTKS